MDPIYESISRYVEEHQEEMLQDLMDLVNLEGHYAEKENVEKAMEFFCELLTKEGFQIAKYEVEKERAGIICAILGADRPGQPILFSGHFDTVHHTGSFGSPACRIQDGKIYGPGVMDMKGGNIMALYVARVLNHLGYQERPIKMILVGDEESDHIHNDADQIITENSRGCLCAFNMEPGDPQNRLVVSRKSLCTARISIEGIGGHAGKDVLTGKNALMEGVYKMAEIAKLADWEKGSSVTPSIFQSGNQSSAIPSHCELAVDIRFSTPEEGERIRKGITEIARHSFIPGTNSTCKLENAKFAPYNESPGISKIHALLNQLAEETGQAPFGKYQSGGVSDAGNMIAAGVPTLDGLGIIGEGSHSLREYGVIQSMYDRTKLLAYAVTCIQRADL